MACSDGSEASPRPEETSGEGRSNRSHSKYYGQPVELSNRCTRLTWRRNIDRILTGSPQSDAGTLSFQEFGLLVCEAIVLRDLAIKTFPKDTFREFSQDFNDLIDNNSGVGRQIRVADRIRWAYAKWL